MTDTFDHPTDKRLSFEAIYHPAEKETGEWNYSLGDPPISAFYEITAVSFNDGTNVVDITEFVLQYCDKLLAEWEDELLEAN